MTLIHQIGAKAERKVEKELLEDFKRVNGKTGMLFQIAEVPLDQPEDVVREVIYRVKPYCGLCHECWFGAD